jgi:Uncharacterized conserved protein
MELGELLFLLEAAENNKKVAFKGLENENMKLGRAILANQHLYLKPVNAINNAKAMTAAEELGVSRETTARDLAMASIVTSCIKSVIKRVTAFCGCAMSAAIGVSAATVYMLGGTYEQQELAMQTVIGTIGGILCDGGKISCAYKLSTAVSLAIEYSMLAVSNIGLEGGIGILGKTIEESIYNLDIINNPGMAATEKVMLDIIRRNRDIIKSCA